MKDKKGFFRKTLVFTVNQIKSRDRFATPISLNYKGESTFKTGIGGLFSLLLLWGLLIYSALLLKQMINRENSGDLKQFNKTYNY